ncbi:MAG TPA: hypothetical protein VLC08_00505 [Chitinolyticbacter sp.]|nr:hypothetical protein [Chitinolyticbacter sp.]
MQPPIWNNDELEQLEETLDRQLRRKRREHDRVRDEERPEVLRHPRYAGRQALREQARF